VRFGAPAGALALALLAAAPVPEQVAPPLPPPRPGTEAPPSATTEAPLPPPRPLPEHAQEPARQAPPTQALHEPPPPGPLDPACPERLEKLGVVFEAKPDVSENECSVRQAVFVSRLPGNLEASPHALMTCALAEGLGRWSLDFVATEAARLLESAPTKVLIGTSYQCRNQRSGTKLSEHALGNAVDVMGFAFAKRAAITIGFLPEGSPELAFQEAIRKGACANFSTVLGPGADADHGNHLHLDQRGRNRGYRICQ